MKRKSFWLSLAWTAALLFILVGCNLPSGTPTGLPAPTVTPQPTSQPPTATSAPSATLTPMPTLTQAAATITKPPIILQKKLYSGVMVYDRKTTDVQAYAFDGKPLGFKSTLPGADWLGATQVQAFENTVYYFSNKDRQVMRRDAQGLQPLAFIPKSDSTHFLISADHKRIAWTIDSWVGNAPGSELWVADISGANAKKVLTKDPKNNPKFLVYHPLRWLSNGQLVFVEEPTGIGGYILFYGFAEIWIIDLSNGKFANFSPPTGKDGLCLKQLSPDTMTAVSTCGAGQSQLVLYDHNTKKATQVAVVPDQGQAGSVVYSPNGQSIAYAVARGNPEKEVGKLVTMPSSGAPVKIIHEVSGGYINVLGWVDSERILFIRYLSDKGTIFVVNKDGSELVKVADGMFAGMIPVP